VTPLRLVRVARPYRLEWATRGVSADGWTTPNQEAVLRFYGNGRRARRTIVVVLSAPPEAPTPVRFAFKVDGSIRSGSVDPGGARPPIRLAICVPAGGHADVVLIPGGGARVPDGRVLALHFDHLGTSVAGPCRSASRVGHAEHSRRRACHHVAPREEQSAHVGWQIPTRHRALVPARCLS